MAVFKRACDCLVEEGSKSTTFSSFQAKIFNELIFNTTFYNSSKIENKSIRDLADSIKQLISEYLKIEDEVIDDDELYFTDSESEGTESDQESLDDDQNEEGLRDDIASQGYSSQNSDQNQTNKNNNSEKVEFDKDLEKQIDLEMLTQKLSYLLNVLKLSLNEIQILKELLVDYLDLVHKVYKEYVYHQIAKLQKYLYFVYCQLDYLYITSSNSYYQIQFYNKTESRSESNNKKELTKGTLGLMKYLKKGFIKQDKLYQKKGIIQSLYIWSLYELLSALICDRKETTLNEDHLAVIKDILDKKDLKLLHIIDRFSMTEDFSLTYGFTRIINELFKFLQKCDSQKFKEIQSYFLIYTVQFIYNIYMVLNSPLESQRIQSIILITKMAYKNKYAVGILLKLFNRSLFYKVETPLDLFMNYNWDENEYKQFFTVVLKRDYDTSTEQWNANVMNELLQKLKYEVENFVMEKKKHHKAISIFKKGELQLTHPTHEFSKTKKIITKVRNLRYNFEELRIVYQNENSEIKILKYYINKLLDEGNETNNNKAYLTVNIKIQNEIIEFWDELKIAFMPSQNMKEKQQLLKVMILVYQSYFEILRELRTMPYWLKLLEFKDYQKCQFLLLQLILQALSVQKDSKNQDIATKNRNIFIELDGISSILKCLNQIFTDLHISNKTLVKKTSNQFDDNYKDINNRQIQFKNYTDYIQNPLHFISNSENVNIGILCFSILDLIMNKDANKYIDPLPKNKIFLLQEDNISIMISLLLLQDIQLTKQVLSFIENHLFSQYALFKFKSSGLIEFLLLYLDTELAEQAYRLLIKMQQVTLDYNNDINFEQQFDENDINMLQDDINNEEQNYQEQNNLQIDEKINKNSIFLRYLPLPLIKKAHQDFDQSNFITIFQSLNYERATLIWNNEMKEKLKETILMNASQLMKQLKQFAVQFVAQDKQKDISLNLEVPRYQGPVKEIIKYSFIENEVRCCQYYLRVWTQQNKKINSREESKNSDKLKIPVNEEQYLMDKLKIILENLNLKEEQLKEPKKLIILLKSCLLALQTFQRQRLTCLLQVKDVIDCLIKAKNVEYNDFIKEALYIGVKTIFTSIQPRKSQENSKDSKLQISISPNQSDFLQQDRHDNLTEILNFKGVQLIISVIGMILFYQKQTLTQSSGSVMVSGRQLNSDKIDDSYDFPINIEDKNKMQNQTNNQHQLKLDKFEAKTLIYCVKTLNILIQEDIQSYIANTFSFKLTMFKYLTKILDTSYQIYKIHKKRSAFDKNKNLPLLQKSVGLAGLQQSKNNALIERSQGLPQKKPQARLSDIKHSQLKVFNFGQNNIDEQISFEKGINEYGLDFSQEQNDKFFNNPQQQISNQISQGVTNENADQSYLKKSSSNRLKENYKLQLEYLNDHSRQSEKQHALKLIFSMALSIFKLSKELSQNQHIHPEIIQSGFPWRCLQHLFFSLIPEYHNNQNVDTMLRDITYTLQHITSFASLFIPKQDDNYEQQMNSQIINKSQFNKINIEDLQFKKMNSEQERKMIVSYYTAIQKLFEKKILQNLECIFNIDGKHQVLAFDQMNQEKLYYNFLKIFSIPEERTSKITWNDHSRSELAQILEEQLNSIFQNENNLEESFYDKILAFDYSVNKNELRLDGIYVNNFNSDIYFRPAEIEKFVEGLLKQFKLILDLDKKNQINTANTCLLDFDDKRFDNVLQIIKAFRNLIQYQNTQIHLISTSLFNFEETIGLFCSVLKIKDGEYSLQKEQRFQTLSSIVFEILKLISKSQKFAEQLVGSIKFAKLVTRAFTIGDKEIFNNEDLKKLVIILQNVLTYDNVDSESFLIKKGMVMFFLHVIFEKSFNSQIRVEIARLLKQKIDEIYLVIGAFMPIHFFTMGEFQGTEVLSEEDMVDQLIKNLDEMHYETQFIIWNYDLKDQQHHKIKKVCEDILKMFRHCKHFDQIDTKLPIQPYQKQNILIYLISIQFIIIVTSPKFSSEVIILEIIVRIFNNNPILFINTQLENFLESMSLQLDKFIFISSQIILILKKNEVDFEAQNEGQLIEVHKNVYTSKQIRKKLRYVAHQTQYVLTAILLTLEQILLNNFNPNKKKGQSLVGSLGASTVSLRNLQGSQMCSQNLMASTNYSQQIDMLQGFGDESKNINDQFFLFIEGWLQNKFFTEKFIPIELRITFQQLLFLIMDIPEAFKKIKSGIVDYINDELQLIHNFEIDKHLEKMFILALCQKVIKQGGTSVIESIFNQNFQNIIDIHTMNSSLSIPIEQILSMMAKNSQVCKDHFIQLSKQKDYTKDRESKIIWKDILSFKLEQQSQDQQETGFLKLWRNKPMTQNEAKKFYNLNENQYIERKIDEPNISKIKMPLISKKAVEEIKREDVLGEDELNSSNLIEDIEVLEKKEKDWEKNKDINIQILQFD